MSRHGNQIANVGSVLLAKSVDTSIALLEGDQRPGDVKVHQTVTVVVKIDALGRRVRAEQNSELAFLDTEVFHHRLLSLVVQTAVEDANGILTQAEPCSQLALQEVERLDAFGEDHHTFGLLAAISKAPQ